jgi:cytochrome P450
MPAERRVARPQLETGSVWMTVVDDLENPPFPVMPPRPARPVSMAEFLRVGQANSLAICDKALFDELFVERRFLWKRFFIISDPDGIRRVLQDNADNFPRLGQVRRVFEFDSESGMLCAEGEPWRRHRRLINPTLDYRALSPDVPALIRFAEELADHLGRLPPTQDIDIGEAITHLLIRSTGHVFAGDDRSVDVMLHQLGQYPGKYGLLDILPVPSWLRIVPSRSRREAKKFQALLDRQFAARRGAANGNGSDLLARLVNARDRRTGECLGDTELRDEALTLGSTAATPLRPLTWLWYLLALYPWAEERLHRELATVLGGRAPGLDDLPKLVYLRNLLDETMRLYPPLPIMLRVVGASDVVCGHPIPRKSVVAIMPWVVHRHRKLWDDPDGFDPDRFTPERAAGRSRYCYLPFSLGAHVCIGASLATIEMVIAVAVLAQRFRFRLVPGHPVEPTAWTNLRPRYGIRVTVEPRTGPTRRWPDGAAQTC